MYFPAVLYACLSNHTCYEVVKLIKVMPIICIILVFPQMNVATNLTQTSFIFYFWYISYSHVVIAFVYKYNSIHLYIFTYSSFFLKKVYGEPFKIVNLSSSTQNFTTDDMDQQMLYKCQTMTYLENQINNVQDNTFKMK